MSPFWRDRRHGRRWGDAFVDRKHNTPEPTTFVLEGLPALPWLEHDADNCPDCQGEVSGATYARRGSLH